MSMSDGESRYALRFYNIGKEHRTDNTFAAENVLAACQELVGEIRVHIPRHRRLHTLFATDVLNHNHGAESLFLHANQG